MQLQDQNKQLLDQVQSMTMKFTDLSSQQQRMEKEAEVKQRDYELQLSQLNLKVKLAEGKLVEQKAKFDVENQQLKLLQKQENEKLLDEIDYYRTLSLRQTQQMQNDMKTQFATLSMQLAEISAKAEVTINGKLQETSDKLREVEGLQMGLQSLGISGKHGRDAAIENLKMEIRRLEEKNKVLDKITMDQQLVIDRLHK